ncbi:MAG: NAD(P)-dependent oxidoreductase [Ilumatobacteraceae bacterium]
MSSERVLVTGANGCLGAWVVKRLLDDGADVVAADVGTAEHRLRAVVDAATLQRVARCRVDIADRAAVHQLVGEGGFTGMIHLAALQVPFCRADPTLGAQVNVVGTVNLMEAYLAAGTLRGPFVFASSVAAYDPEDTGESNPGGRPRTLYGVYKLATEHAAAVYADERGLTSIGLRPHVVYGIGRDQGMTSSPTVAMLRAAAGKGSSISYSGASQLQYTDDVARMFIAASRAVVDGAHLYNVGGESVDMTEVVAAIELAAPDVSGRVAIDGSPLPFPAAPSEAGLVDAVGSITRTSLVDGVAATIDGFRHLLDAQLVKIP